MERRVFPITQEIEDLFIEAHAADQMRDSIIGSVVFLFMEKRAYKYAKRSVEASKQAWRAVVELYPESKNLKLSWGNQEPGTCVYTIE